MKGSQVRTSSNLSPVSSYRPSSPSVTLLLWMIVLLVVAEWSVLAAPARRRSQWPSPNRTPGCLDEYVGARAYLAQTVFEGKVRSRSPARNGIYNVTFVVQRVLKGEERGFLGSQVRLQFHEDNGGDVCPGDSVVRVNIARRGNYIVFVDHDRLERHIFQPRGEPVKQSKKNLRDVDNVLCRDCVKPPVLANLRTNITINRTERIRLACKAKSGMPIPSLQWYKEGKRLLPNVRIRIVVKKRKRSILVIKKAEPEDSGVYECRATSATGDTVSSTSRVMVLSPEATTTPKAEPLTTSWPYNEQLCLFSAYCLNGGTCIKTGSLEEIHCVCAEGFKGLRCAEKDVSNKSNVDRGLWAIQANTRPFLGESSDRRRRFYSTVQLTDSGSRPHGSVALG